jgi:hypothetical protein
VTAPAPTTLDLITAALEEIGALAGGETPSATDTDLALRRFNFLVSDWNTRKRFAYFMRSQQFTFTNSQQSYSIGTSANSADFVVSAGDRPARLEFAQLVLTDSSPNVEILCEVINVELYVNITVPSLSSQFPRVIYYKPTVPNGTIVPYPAFPTKTSYKLDLSWWNQLETVAIADIATALVLPPGYANAMVLTLAEKLARPMGRPIDAELKQQARQARANIQSLNMPAPVISSTDGVTSGGRGYIDWRSRTYL